MAGRGDAGVTSRTVGPSGRATSGGTSPPWVLGLSTCIAALTMADPARPQGYDTAIETSRAAIRSMMQRAAVPGVSVGVAVRGEIVWSEAFGFVDVKRRSPASPSTLFGIGSVSKSLTAALAGRLVDQRLLDLDVPIERYLPDFPHAGKGITTRLIAGHLSGLDDTFDAANAATTLHYGTREALPRILDMPLRHTPGTQSFYSTSSYTVIAGVVEKVTGRPFEESMRQRVLGPLHMASTAPNDPRARDPRTASFYVQGADGRPALGAPYDPSFKLAGAGYLSSAEDLVRFGSALLSPGFLSMATLEQIFAPLRTLAGEETGFGLGWRVGSQAGSGMSWNIGPDDQTRRIVHQPGGGTGISCWLVVDRDARLVVAILSNLTGAPVGGRTMDAVFESFLAAGGRPPSDVAPQRNGSGRRDNRSDLVQGQPAPGNLGSASRP